VLQDGVGVGDASTTSPDHAVGAEALAADRIEVLRGPSTLLYGSSAVGGVVNLIDGRIPRELPDRALSGTVRGLAGTVSDETTGDLRLTGRVGRFAWHASGLRRDTEDFDIPGPAELEAHGSHEGGGHGAGEAQHGGDPDPGHGATETGGERLENSDLRTTRGALGLSYVGERGYVGISWSGHDSRYGVPGHAHGDEDHGDGHGDAAIRAAPDADDGAGGIVGEEGHGEEEVDIDLQQRRVDLAGAWDFDGSLLRGLRARFGVADYRHFELEGPEVGTRFENDQWEARLEARHGVGDALSGALGLQLGNRDFRATGEEAFVPPAGSRSLGIFLFEELATGPLTYQLGARWERQDARNELTGREVDHQGVSVSAGVNWSAAAPLTLTASGSRSVKLPTSEELFADGPHLATRSFEVGNPALDEEVAWTGEVGALLSAGRLSAELHWFASRFEGFVYQAFTDREEDGLPVRPFTQDDAFFTGLEAGAGVDLLREARRRLSLDVSGDWVRGELLDADAPLPRIPPFRLGGGAEYEDPAWSVRTALRRITGQDRVAALETPTAGYTMLDASVSRRFRLRGLTHELILSGTNLTDEVARSHVSFLKDVAPLPGREVRLSYRVSF
jgi:iron complex outermembrane receptor protein